MDFGKLSNIASVDFTLPPDPPGNAAVFEKLSQPPKSEIRNPKCVFLGATGWGMKEWVGKFYPKGAKPTEYLRHYARQFNTIELNTTHYRIPDLFTVQHWHDEAAADFRFCPKVLQTISHAADLGAGNDLTLRFCEAMEGLREKLGCCFMQLPPHFGSDRLPVLEGFLRRFSLPLAVEVRHEGWFSNPLNFNRLFDLLEKYETATVITDVAGRRDVAHMRLTTGTVLVRFVGNNLDPTDFTRIDDWVRRLEEWFARGLQQVFFFTHEPDNLLAPDLAMYFLEKLQRIGGIETRGPKVIRQENTGQQMSLF